MRKKNTLVKRGIAIIMSFCMAAGLTAAPLCGSVRADAADEPQEEKREVFFALSVRPLEGADVQSSISIAVSAEAAAFAAPEDAAGLYAELALTQEGDSYPLGSVEFQHVGDNITAELAVDLGELFGSAQGPVLNGDSGLFDLTAGIAGLDENYEVSSDSELTITGYSIQKAVNCLSASIQESGAEVTYGETYCFCVSQSEDSGNPVVITQIMYEDRALTQEEAAAVLRRTDENTDQYIFDSTVCGAGQYIITAETAAGPLTTAAERQLRITVLPAVVAGKIAAVAQTVSKQYDGTSAVTAESYTVVLDGVLEAERLPDARDYFEVSSADYYWQEEAAAGCGQGYCAVIVLELKGDYARNYRFADGTTRLTAELDGEILSNISFSYGNGSAYHDCYYQNFQTVMLRVDGCDNAEAVTVTVRDGENRSLSSDEDRVYTERIGTENGYYTDTLAFMQEGDYWIEVSYDFGNGTETNSTGLFHVDTAAPYITSGITEDYYNQTVNAVLTIEEHFFDSTPLSASAPDWESGVSVSITGTKGNGAAVTAADYSCDNLWRAAGDGTDCYTCAVTLRENADYTITVVCVDMAGRRSVYEKTVSVDKSAPQINIVFQESAGYAADYYRETLYADVEISERNFDSELADIVIRKNGVIVDAADYVQGGWQTAAAAGAPDETKHRLTLCFQEDGAYTVSVSCRDEAGNDSGTETTAVVTVDKTPPQINVSYDLNGGQNGSCYNAAITAEIQITEHNFNSSDVQITVIQRDAEGNTISGRTYSDLSAWSSGGDVHTAGLVFEGPANYDISVSCTDKAGLRAEVYTAHFTVDTDMPSGTVSVSGMGVWSRMFGAVLFGCFANTSRTVTITAADATSSVAKTEYLLSPSEMTLAQLQASAAWQSYAQPFSLTPDTQTVVYVRLTDAAGNVAYINSDGIILDAQAPVPRIEIETPQSSYAIYNQDVSLAVTVCDTAVNGVYTGLASVRYEVYNGTELTQSGSFDCSTLSGRRQELSGMIIVDSTKNNSDNITVYVYAEDNAGNAAQQQIPLNIDVTAPQVSAELSEASAEHYYGAGTLCQAELVIYERNFDASLVTLRVLRNGAETDAYTISAWSVQTNRYDAEQMKHTARVSFPLDGEYTFEVYCQDKAGNAVVYRYAETYIVDTEAPLLSIGYEDGIAASNQIYYRGDKTVVIRIQERNFDAAEMYIEVTGRAAADGAPITVVLPDEEAWDHAGDIHTYSFTLTEDGVYDIMVMGGDKARNRQTEILNERLVIDHQAPQITVSINDIIYDRLENKALNAQTIVPRISVSDNYGLDTVEVSIVSYGGVQEWELEKPEAVTEYNAVFDGVLCASEWIYDNIEQDGVYLITVRAADMAGNEAELFSDLISVNRNGSVFYLDKESFSYRLVCDVTTSEAISERFVIYESNVGRIYDSMLTVETSRSGTKLLEEGVDYTVGETQETPYSLYVVSYEIFPEVFAQEEHYTISIISRDDAENYNDSQIKNDGDPQEYDFFYDCTAPVLMFSGIEDMASYNQEALRFYIDTNTGDLTGIARVELTIDGETTVYGYGDDADEPLDESGVIEAVLEAAAARQRIQISVTDGAGNVNNSYRFRVQVTTNLFWLFVYNTPLFIGTLVSILLLLALFVCIVVYVRRRKLKKHERKGRG